MKQTYLAIFLLAILGLCSCRKEGNDIGIKEYDKQQIEAYIKANGFTNMKRDLTDGDTTGIYYEILSQGTGDDVDYSTRIAFVYTIKSLDGKYVVTDTITNHSYNYVGSLAPKGLMLAMRNLVKKKGTSAHIIIPSRLAYGQSGSGTGSGRLPGNTSLDYYINLINDKDLNQDKYDELSIRKFAQANGIDISTYNHDNTTGLFWKKTQADTGKVVIGPTSTVYMQYTGSLLNGTQFDISSNSVEGGVPLNMEGVIKGFSDGVQKVKAGAYLSLLIPSKIAYGYLGSVDQNTQATVIPAFSCLRFEIKVLSVSN